MSDEKEVFRGSYFSMFDDGGLGHHDGAGFCGETDASEVREFYEFLKKFYDDDWISVDDRLPEIGEKVIVFLGNDQMYAYYGGRQLWKCTRTGISMPMVTHWMMRPDKPKD